MQLILCKKKIINILLKIITVEDKLVYKYKGILKALDQIIIFLNIQEDI